MEVRFEKYKIYTQRMKRTEAKKHKVTLHNIIYLFKWNKFYGPHGMVSIKSMKKRRGE